MVEGRLRDDVIDMKTCKTILLCTLGRTPQVLAETVWVLANQEDMIVPDEIVAVSMNNFAGDAKDSIWGKGNGWSMLIDKLRKAKIPTSGKLHFEDVVVATDENGPIQDLRTVEDNTRCANYIFMLLRKYMVESDDTRIIVSLSGGRKSLSALVTANMSLFARPQDKLVHLIADAKLEDGKYHFPKEGQGYSLFEVPFVRTRGLIRGVDIGKVKSFAECMRITQERISGVQDYPEITINAADASFKVRGCETQSVTGIFGSRFLFLWLLFKMKSLDADRFMKIMCKAHAIEGFAYRPGWFLEFQRKCDKFLDAATIDCARGFSKVKHETMREVLRKSGLTDMQCEALYPRTKKGKPIPFEFGIAYPGDRLNVNDTDFTRQLEKELLGNLS